MHMKEWGSQDGGQAVDHARWMTTVSDEEASWRRMVPLLLCLVVTLDHALEAIQVSADESQTATQITLARGGGRYIEAVADYLALTAQQRQVLREQVAQDLLTAELGEELADVALSSDVFATTWV
jgi:hypothetical protein